MPSQNLQDEDKSRKLIYRDKNLLVIFGVTLMAIIGVTSITPAFPKIVEQLEVSPSDVGLLISVFTGPMIVLTLVFGLLADKFGKKKIIVPSLFLFGIAGGLCSLAQDFNQLLILRFVQGIGGASLFPLATSTICDLYSGKELTTALGYNSSVNQLGHTMFPAMGGALAMFGWNYPFLLPLLAIPIGVFILLVMKEPKLNPERNFKKYLILAFSSMKNRQIIGIFITGTFLFIITYGAYLTYLPFLLSNSFGASPFLIGLIILVMYLTSATTSSQVGKLAKRMPERKLIKIAFLMYAPALVLIPSMPNLWTLILPIVILGITWGIAIPSVYSILADVAPENCRTAIIGMSELFVRAGQTIGPILMFLAFSSWGISGVFYTAAGFSILLFIIVAILIR